MLKDVLKFPFSIISDKLRLSALIIGVNPPLQVFYHQYRYFTINM